MCDDAGRQWSLICMCVTCVTAVGPYSNTCFQKFVVYQCYKVLSVNLYLQASSIAGSQGCCCLCLCCCPCCFLLGHLLLVVQALGNHFCDPLQAVNHGVPTRQAIVGRGMQGHVAPTALQWGVQATDKSRHMQQTCTKQRCTQ